MSQVTLPEGMLPNSDAQSRSPVLTGASILGAFKFVINMICFFSGLVLLGIGSYLIYHILTEIYQAYLHIDQNVFVGTLIDWLHNKPVFLNPNDEPFLLGKAGAVIISVTLGGLVASICTQIALMFFKTGIKVLSLRFNG